MLKLVERFRDNASLLNISGGTLIFVSLYGLCIIYKNSNANYGLFKYKLAAFGFCMIIGDTLNAIIYKTKHPLEPLFPVKREILPKNVSLIYPSVEILCTDAVPCLTCSLYIRYNISLSGRIQFILIKIGKEVDWFFKKVFRPQCHFWRTPFIELILAGNMLYFGLIFNDHYSIMAAATYQIATLFFNPGNYYSQKNKRALYNIFMVPYVLCITQSLCE